MCEPNFVLRKQRFEYHKRNRKILLSPNPNHNALYVRLYKRTVIEYVQLTSLLSKYSESVFIPNHPATIGVTDLEVVGEQTRH